MLCLIVKKKKKKKNGDLWYEFPDSKSVLVAGKVWEVSDTNSDFEDNLYVLGIDYWYDL